MRKAMVVSVVAIVAIAAAIAFFGSGTTEAGKKGAAMVSHDVYFALKDNSAKARQDLVDACKKHLSKHPGEMFFAVGTVCDDLKREVNDRDFDVVLHIVFRDLAAHDKYQEAERHKKFIDENKANWTKVRVFDSYVDVR